MATITWDGGAATQNWQDANNWDTDNVPTGTDDVIIPTGMGTIAGTPSSSVNTLTVNGDSQLNVTLSVSNSVAFNNTSKNLGTITVNGAGALPVVFGDTTENVGTITASGSATVAFEDTAENSGTVTASGSATVAFGNSTFDNASNAINSGGVTAAAAINVYYPSAKPLGGTVTGTITYNNYTRTWTAGGGTWETGSNWTDGAVPGIYADVVIDSNIIVSGTPPSAVVSVTMSNNVFLEVGSLTAGTFTQNGSGRIKNGTFTGTFVFNDDTQNENATLIGDSTFNDDSINLGTITGDAYFYDDSINDNTVSGDAYIRQHAAAFLVWRNKATTTFVTGDIFLQFPEMDILGTGLL